MVDQISHLTSEVASLRATLEVSIADKVRLPLPDKFIGAGDGDTVHNFITSLQNWFDLVQLNNENQRARFCHTLLEGPALDWFEVQRYHMSFLNWCQLSNDLLYQFRPADYRRMAQKRLNEVIMGKKRDFHMYINRYNVALNKCDDLPSAEALSFFEDGLAPAIALQVYSAQAQNLREAQQVAQAAGLALQTPGAWLVPKKSTAFIRGPHAFHGPGEMEQQQSQCNLLKGRSQGKLQAPASKGKQPANQFASVCCFNCNKLDHYASHCPEPHREQNNNAEGQPSTVPELQKQLAQLSQVVAKLAKYE